MRSVQVCLAFVLCLGACSGAATGPKTADRREPSAAEKVYPALRWVPADATYVMTGIRTADLLTAGRELIAALGLLGDFDVMDVDREFVSNLGVNPLSADALADAGIALDRGVALFSQEISPVVILPVADEAKLSGFLEQRQPDKGLAVRRYGEHEWFSWPAGARDAIHWVRWDGHIAIRLSIAADPGDTAWLDGIFGKSGRVGDHPNMKWTVAETRSRLPGAKPPALLGFMHVGAFVEALGQLASGGEAKALAACATIIEPIDELVGVGVRADWSSADGVVILRMKHDAATALAGHVSAPPPGFAAFRQKSNFYATWALDVHWLEVLRAGLGCPALDVPLVGRGGLPRNSPRGGHVAVEQLSVSDLTAARAAMHLELADPLFAKSLLAMIPKRRWFEKSVKIAGHAAKTVKVPGVISIGYLLGDTAMTATMTAGLLEPVLAGPGPEPPDQGALVAALAIRPTRLVGLSQLLELSADFGPITRSMAERSYRRLSRYEHGAVHLVLDGDALILELGMRLAQ